MLAQQTLTPPDLVAGDLAVPLEGCVRFGHERGDRDRDADTSPLGRGRDLTGRLDHPCDELADGGHVLIGLGGKPQHEVELHPAPTRSESGLDGAEQLVFGDVLVDGVAQALRTCLRGERQTALASLAEQPREAERERVHAQRRHRHRDGRALQTTRQAPHDVLQLRVVRRGKRRERDLLVAGARQRAERVADDRVRRTFPDGAVDHPGLAEAAAARATAQHLDGHPVVDDVGVRHHGAARRWHRLEVAEDPPAHAPRSVAARLECPGR